MRISIERKAAMKDGKINFQSRLFSPNKIEKKKMLMTILMIANTCQVIKLTIVEALKRSRIFNKKKLINKLGEEIIKDPINKLISAPILNGS